RVAVMTVRLLDEQQIAIVAAVAQIREVVLAATEPLDAAGVLQQQARLTDQIEREVRERKILLGRRTVPAPLRQAMPEHEIRVAEPEQILEELRAGGSRSQRFSTSSGIV